MHGCSGKCSSKFITICRLHQWYNCVCYGCSDVCAHYDWNCLTNFDDCNKNKNLEFEKNENLRNLKNLLLLATIVTTIEVDVDELWTSTVTRTPIIKPTTGFCNNSLSWKKRPTAREPNKRNAVDNKSKEHMKKYNKLMRKNIFAKIIKIRCDFSALLHSVKTNKN